MKAHYFPYDLIFRQPAGTSRGTLYEKKSWFVILQDKGKVGIGECGVFKGLSFDDRKGYEARLKKALHAVESEAFHMNTLEDWPSIALGIEMAMRDLEHGGNRQIFRSDFMLGDPIPINGLVWMGERDDMLDQIEAKISAGFSCVKMKIGAIDFEDELYLLKHIRREFTARDIEIRVDANGAFEPKTALEKLKQLSNYKLHSIEQPIMAGQWDHMAKLCELSPLPIALDEELIGIHYEEEKRKILDTIKPQAIILKPSLLGNFNACDEWIEMAQDRKIAWWATSALESNIGLNAIAQWISTKEIKMHQGLGTGQLYTNNIESPLKVIRGHLRYDPAVEWNLELFEGVK